MRLLILGWDGADPALVRKFLGRGRLPNLAALIARGLFAELPSTVPDDSLVAWTAAITGVGPGRHGLVHFVRRPPGEYRLELCSSRDRRAATIFERLTRAGRRVASLGIPGTFPPAPDAGICIAGFDSPLAMEASARAFLPRALYDELRARGLAWPYGGLDELSVAGSGWHRKALVRLRANVRAKTAVIEALLAKPLDLLWAVFSESDTAAHHLWAASDPESPRHRPDPALGDALGEVYAELDAALGRLVAAAGPDATVVVLSDHGSGGTSDWVVHLNRFLSQTVLKFRPRSATRRFSARLLGRLGQEVPGAIKQAVMRGPLARLALRADALARFGGLDLAHTEAFSDELPQHPGIWIHQAGRDPLGPVPESCALSLRDAVAERLLGWREPTIGPVVARVLRPEDVYRGPARALAPDLLVELARPSGYRLLCAPSDGPDGPLVRRLSGAEQIGPKGIGCSGAHAPVGLLAAGGAGVGPLKDGAEVRLEDVAATALALLEVPVPADLEGRPIAAIVTSAEVGPSEAPVARPGALGFTAAEEAVLSGRLAELGYL